MATIKLADGFYIVAKGTNVQLKRDTIKTKVNDETLEEEQHTSTETWYFLTHAQALGKYKDLMLLPCTTTEELAKRLDVLERTIKGIKL